jgi:L-ascorbate metabolism protein UlaG (beta-lactamase superfamily)
MKKQFQKKEKGEKFGTIKYVNAILSSSFPDGSYGGQPGGFVISANNKNIYIAGDTALSFDMMLIPLKNRLDFVVLPIGDNFYYGNRRCSNGK